MTMKLDSQKERKTFFQKRTFLTKYLLDASFTSSPDCMVQDFFLTAFSVTIYARICVCAKCGIILPLLFCIYVAKWRVVICIFGDLKVSPTHYSPSPSPPMWSLRGKEGQGFADTLYNSPQKLYVFLRIKGILTFRLSLWENMTSTLKMCLLTPVPRKLSRIVQILCVSLSSPPPH